jgi:hypothetical protein
MWHSVDSFASILDQLKSGRPQSAVADTQSTTASGAASSVGGTSGCPPPGLSESALKRFSSDNPPSPDDLEKVMSCLRICLNIEHSMLNIATHIMHLSMFLCLSW